MVAPGLRKCFLPDRKCLQLGDIAFLTWQVCARPWLPLAFRNATPGVYSWLSLMCDCRRWQMLYSYVTSCRQGIVPRCTSRVAVSDPTLHASCRVGAVSKVQPNTDVRPNEFSLNQDAFTSKSVYTLTAACFSFLLYKSPWSFLFFKKPYFLILSVPYVL